MAIALNDRPSIWKAGKTRIRMTSGERVYQIIAWIVIGLVMLTCIVPACYVVSTSITTKLEIARQNGFVLIPRQIQLQAYKTFFLNQTIIRAIGVSLARVVLGVVLQLLICALAAYALCKQTLPGRKFFMTVLIISMLVGPGLIPAYLWSIQNGTYNTFLIYILPGAYNAWAIVLFRQFFLALPEALLESARIDGASEWQVMFRIMLPLSKAIFATLALFGAVGFWNDFMTNMIYVRKAELMTIAFFLQQTLTGVSQMWLSQAASVNAFQYNTMPPAEAYKMAAVVISTVPILLVYPFLQKHFAYGMLTGAIKG